MSRAALRRQEGNVQERERQAQEAFQVAVEEGRNNRARNLVPLHGPDDTFNLNPMLLRNIIKSPYFISKCCKQIHDWNALVDEIYYEVKHVEPWTVGASKMPSTAFCLLLRLFTLRCTEKQMKLLLQHVDSPYIRCIGFLYLRYACEPRALYDWMEPYLYDEEPVRVEANQARPEMTMGDYVRKLLTDMNYYGTLLPRLPVQVERDIKVKLLQAQHMEARAKKHQKDKRVMDYLTTLGSRVRALYGDEENPVTWYDAVVDRVLTKDEETGAPLARPKFVVTFPEYGNTEVVTLGEMDMPDGRNSEIPDSKVPPVDDRGRNHGRYDDRGHHVYQGRGTGSRGDGPPARQDRWDRDRRPGHRDGHRSRSRERDSRAVPSEKDLMEEVLRQERERSTAKGRAYASRPPSTKASLSVSAEHGRKRSRSPSPRERYHDRPDVGKPAPEKPKIYEQAPPPAAPAPAPPRPKTAEELAAIAEKKRKLMAKYG